MARLPQWPTPDSTRGVHVSLLRVGPGPAREHFPRVPERPVSGAAGESAVLWSGRCARAEDRLWRAVGLQQPAGVLQDDVAIVPGVGPAGITQVREARAMQPLSPSPAVASTQWHPSAPAASLFFIDIDVGLRQSSPSPSRSVVSSGSAFPFMVVVPTTVFSKLGDHSTCSARSEVLRSDHVSERCVRRSRPV